ncbi:MAG: RNA polymerase sigma-H factor [Armatimonadota bacterium]|nr:MAG: RNA polymerase sigma-H factor [Armatimonadota bacterium]
MEWAWGTAVCDEASCNGHQQPICEGDTEQFFAQLLRRYRNPIVNLAYQMLGDREEAEDVAQETFVQAFVHLRRFRGQSSLFTWLYRIAVNACRMRLRQRRLLPLLDERYADDADFDERAWMLKQQVDETLRQLPEPLREVLILREMHELSYEQIAQVLGVPVGTVRSRLHTARQRFAQLWEQQQKE